MEFGEYHLTWQARYDEIRKALAGEPVMTPLELCIYMGMDYDEVTEEMQDDACRDLRAQGYRREMVPIRFYGPLEERWVRHDVWPEDVEWAEADRRLSATSGDRGG